MLNASGEFGGFDDRYIDRSLDLMSDCEPPCSRQEYDTVRQLIELADRDDEKGFFRLLKKEKNIFTSAGQLADVTVTAGLMARNKARILEKYLKQKQRSKVREFDEFFPLYEPMFRMITVHLAGILIGEKRCREAVVCWLKSAKLTDEKSIRYILTRAIKADDAEIFRLVCRNEPYASDIGYCLYVSGVLGSRKILDEITDCGRHILTQSPELNCSFDDIVRTFGACSEETMKWVENIYSYYLKDMDNESACRVMLAMIDSFLDAVSRDSSFVILRRRIMKMFGCRTRDLSDFANNWTDVPIESENSPDPEIVLSTTAAQPYVSFRNNFWSTTTDVILRLSEILPEKLTVKLVSGFDGSDIEKLAKKTHPEINLRDPETADYLRGYFKNMYIDLLDEKDLAVALIMNGLADVDGLTELGLDVCTPVFSPELIKTLYDKAGKDEPII